MRSENLPANLTTREVNRSMSESFTACNGINENRTSEKEKQK